MFSEKRKIHFPPFQIFVRQFPDIDLIRHFCSSVQIEEINDGAFVLEDGQIIVWGNDIEDMKIIHKFQGSEEGIRSLCNANGKLVSGSFQTIQIWDLVPLF